eukprot:TRINITY_DN1670_c0_g1_i18.p2 TRINITY_DN1670_c0_g1~~TRINITY_DN1670_c0_g1_i18.p2  ORF type:complete len:143 (-),score=12.18 TRINITY_DN1670_c0_g1_i18:8-436(-)
MEQSQMEKQQRFSWQNEVSRILQPQECTADLQAQVRFNGDTATMNMGIPSDIGATLVMEEDFATILVFGLVPVHLDIPDVHAHAHDREEEKEKDSPVLDFPVQIQEVAPHIVNEESIPAVCLEKEGKTRADQKINFITPSFI